MATAADSVNDGDGVGYDHRHFSSALDRLSSSGANGSISKQGSASVLDQSITIRITVFRAVTFLA